MNTTTARRAARFLAALLCALVLVGCCTAMAVYADYAPPAALIEAWKQNSHVIGGLMIPGTTVGYPILEHPTVDDYYLNICIDGTEGYPGSIYTNKVEGKMFDTFNTVIYGHNMRDGSYFGALRDFLDEDFLNEHRQIFIFALDKVHVYDIFAVSVYNDKRITDYFPDDKPADRQAFLDSLREDSLPGSILLDDVPVDIEGHIITLSTCITDMHDNRLLIVAYERE
ncbi:MAG: class B sortase [Oscillospiraceae bacterium]|nr:class B sortase [Oscillospiraceae bacterium]